MNTSPAALHALVAGKRVGLKLGVLGAGLLLAICALLPMVLAAQSSFPDVCANDPHNLVDNCGFDDHLDHWRSFVTAGNPPGFSVENAYPACDSPDCPALRILAEDWFVGGIYQRISGVVPGQAYWANVIWLVYDPAGALDNTVGRWIGIDASGGTNPDSPDVVWSQDVWQSFSKCPYKICRELQVQAIAQNTTITLFVRIEDTWKQRRNEFPQVPPSYFEMMESFWIDDVGMMPVDNSSPTPTPAPVATLISSSAGGRLVSNDNDRSVTIEFPPGAVEESSVVTYAYQLPLPMPASMAGNDRFFHLEATRGVMPITQLNEPVTIAVRYPAINPLERDTISLYRLSGTLWTTGGTTTVTRGDFGLTSTTSNVGLFALLGETNRCYVPVILK